MLAVISTNNEELADKNYDILSNKFYFNNEFDPFLVGNIVVNSGSCGLPEIYNQAVKTHSQEN